MKRDENHCVICLPDFFFAGEIQDSSKCLKYRIYLVFFYNFKISNTYLNFTKIPTKLFLKTTLFLPAVRIKSCQYRPTMVNINRVADPTDRPRGGVSGGGIIW